MPEEVLMEEGSSSVVTKIMSERAQDQTTRKQLYTDLENELGRPVISYFTSFRHPVMVDDTDADMLEGMLQGMDLSNGLALLVSSPGGDGVAAERIINICRSYSGTGEFYAIVPGKAKSAATMICLGASKVFMGPASELGPVDPQIITYDDHERPFSVSLFHIVQSYEDLFSRAICETGGKIEPYLQQLSKYDATLISHFKSSIALAEDISIKALKSGMMAGQEYDSIKRKIEIFLTPELSKTHGRPIFADTAKNAGLIVEDMDNKSKVGGTIFELYIRAKFCTEQEVAKLIENLGGSVVMTPPQER
jgi:hypothetical protein